MKLKIDDFKKMINVVKGIMHENKDYLIELDAAMGDGDLGLTITAGFDAAAESINNYSGNDIGMALLQSAMAMNNAASSTMGTLVSSAIMRAGKPVKGKEKVDIEDFITMAEGTVEGIQARGKAKVGDKTILDSLVPAVDALKKELENGKTLAEAYMSAYQAAQKGVEATKDMVSQHGRAHYYGEKSKGKQDPGATVAMLATRAISDYFNNK